MLTKLLMQAFDIEILLANANVAWRLAFENVEF